VARIASAASQERRASRPETLRSQSRWLIRPAQVRALFWLSAKLRLRGYTRSWQQTVGLVVLLVFLVPLAVAVGVSSWFAYTWLDHPYAVELLFVVLFGLYVLWAILPLLQYTLNEGLDVTRLQTYPVTRAEQMVALVLVTLMDVSTLFIVGLFVAILVGWNMALNPVAIALTLAALALAYIHIVSLSQLVLATLMGLLRSRRYRDLSIILLAFFGAACAVSGQIISYLARGADVTALVSLPIVDYLQWTPPGMAAQAIARASEGAYGEAALWLAPLVALVPLLVALWAFALDRGITTAEAGGATRGGKRAAAATVAAPRPAARSTRSRRSLIPAPVRAVAGKDLRYYWRDPQLKAMILSSLLILVFIFLPRLTAGLGAFRTGGFLGSYALYAAPIPAIFLALNLSLNAFGLERQAAQTLFLFPVRPLYVLWGKNLAVAFVAAAALLVSTLGLAALSGRWEDVPTALTVGLAGVLVTMGCGNIISILLPNRVRQMRTGENRIAGENGCLRALLSGIALTIVWILLVPVAAAVALPLFLARSELLPLTLFAGVLYAVALYQLATWLIAPFMLKRAPEILEVVAREA
jgi:ABC-2 type transport system permease protein